MSVLGFEPRLPRPQRGILTTRRHRLTDMTEEFKIFMHSVVIVNKHLHQILL